MSQTMNNDFEINIQESIELREEENMNDFSEDAKLHAQIYRFKFTEEFMADLYKFAKIHQYDHRKDFKEAWIIWTEENEDLVQEEIDRLLTLGYDGEILEKMFKSARYYFRKKSPIKVEPKQRRQYISVTHEILEAMDKHIRTNISLTDYQPKNGFATFCRNNEELVKDSIHKILNQGINDSELIQLKLKKTYKNRYFMLINKAN